MTTSRPAPSPTRRALGVILRLAVLGLAAGFLARGTRWGEVWSHLRGVRPWLLVAVIALNGTMMLVRAVRLRLLLTPKRPTLADCFLTLLTSAAINNVAPLRAGDVARLWMLQEYAAVTKAAALAVGAIEHLLEITALASLAFGGSFFVPGQRWATVIAPVAIGVALVLLAILRLWTHRAPAPPRALPRGPLRHRLQGWVEPFRERSRAGAGILASPVRLTQAAALSFAGCLCEVAMVVVCARALRLTISPALAMVTLLGINLAIAVPSTPSNAGPFEGAAVIVLTLAGWAKPSALVFALTYHAVQVVPVTLAGLAVAMTKRMRLTEILSREAEGGEERA